jgi:hypothetical protein
MKTFFTLIFVLFTLLAFSQNRFENGYIINNNNERTECLIKNEGWNSNPTTFFYKLNEHAEIIKGDLKQIKEFGIGNIFRFKRFKLSFDRSSNTLQSMSTVKEPINIENTIYLRHLVEGVANLYYYQDSNLRRFFF